MKINKKNIDSYKNFINKATTKFGYDIALELSTNKKYHNNKLGGRTAGSKAEHLAADYLVEVMKNMGLSEVEKVAINVDKWQQNDSYLYIDDKEYTVSSYASMGTSKHGIEAEIVYLNYGTLWDYKELDVTNKIVLIDLDMRNHFWINYPMLEAKFHKALAIISSNVGGFSQINDDALNNQDICSPLGIPCVSISVKNSNEIKDKIKTKTTYAKLIVDNTVTENALAYNIVGRIKGKNSNYQIVIGSHYDMYFQGFQDNCIACGLALAIGKGMIDSNYIPENDIVIVLHAAEEWGSLNTQYDWTIGAYEMVNSANKDWSNKTLAFINFELPAYRFNDHMLTASNDELFTLIKEFNSNQEICPNPLSVYPNGIKDDGLGLYTFSDDFTYSITGIPSMVNGSVTYDSVKSGSYFMKNYYHSNYDTYDTYDEEIMRYHLEYYGALAIFIDNQHSLLLDFTALAKRLKNSINYDIFKYSKIDTTELINKIELLEKVSKELNNETNSGINNTEKYLKAFKFSQNKLLSLMYERPITPHIAPMDNIELMIEVINYLENKDLDNAIEKAGLINNGYEFENMYFSKEVMSLIHNMNWSKENQDNLYWGRNKSFIKANVETASRSLKAKQLNNSSNFNEEIEIYNKAILEQIVIFNKIVLEEIKDIETLINLLSI